MNAVREVAMIDLFPVLPEPCMGGFCGSRDRCAHYHSVRKHPPAERLCGAEETPVALSRVEMAGGKA